MNDEHEPYRPSHGSEGEGFMARWCAHCADRGEDWECPILLATMAVASVWDDEYPAEWRQDGPRGPRCTAFREDASSPQPLDPAAVIRPLL